jgi:hypothetical protein
MKNNVICRWFTIIYIKPIKQFLKKLYICSMDTKEMEQNLRIILENIQVLRAEVDQLKEENGVIKNILKVQTVMNEKILQSLGEVRDKLDMPRD